MVVCFSYSAPQYTEEDEKRDRASLTNDEKRLIDNDLHGRLEICLTRTQEAALLQTAEKEAQTILDAKPDTLKERYHEALKQCPELVETESNMHLFLRSVHYDATAAVDKLLQYWDMRYSLFEERAYLPMLELDGKTGALSKEDVDFMRLNPQCVTLLPTDAHGRHVLYLERSYFIAKSSDHKKKNHHQRLRKVRIVWFWAHVALLQQDNGDDDETCFGNGCDFVYLSNRNKNPKHQNNVVDEEEVGNNSNNSSSSHHHHNNAPLDRMQEKRLWSSLTVCLPIRVRAIHILTDGSQTSHMMVRYKLVFLPNKDMRMRVTIHNHASSDKLAVYGFMPHGLPSTCVPGGTHTFDTPHLPHHMRQSLLLPPKHNDMFL